MQSDFVKIVFNLPINEAFTYSVPKEMVTDVHIGVRVFASFGKKNLTGIVVSFTRPEKEFKIKPLIKILDSIPVITGEMIKFCEWISGYYFCPIGEVIFSAIPKSILIESKIIYSINEDYLIKTFSKIPAKENKALSMDSLFKDNEREPLNSIQEKILKVLKNKPLTLKQIEKSLNTGNLRPVIIKLLEMDIVKSESITSAEKVRPKKEKYVLFDLLDEFEGFSKSMIQNFARESRIKSSKQVEILEYLIKNKLSSIKLKVADEKYRMRCRYIKFIG